VQHRIDKLLKDVDYIHSMLHPMGDPDPNQNLYQAIARKEDAIRATVIQMALAIEDLLDGLFRKRFVGHMPLSEKRVRKGKLASELDDLLEGGRMGFEAKLKLARVLRILTKKQQRRLDKLRSLRNKCAHAWLLDVIRKRGRTPRPTKRLLEHEGKNLFDLKILEDFMHEYSGIYLRLFDKYLS